MAQDLSDVRFLTVAEVAEMMRVSNMTVYRMVHAGELPAVRFILVSEVLSVGGTSSPLTTNY